ncbi:diguanylate cyclase [Tamilnaduibacter salinus]|uniref:Diguanylate cyclase n=1 Tax=Tamilnaduibacter salinus TaxID=1484056 RepID=A0A2A2I3F5_9GAMM|nr:DUF1631 family protein [Tamilnaduibacter salinus]PAV25640.1 diguanylate cyclase [Tamilnaduibacter salinus]
MESKERRASPRYPISLDAELVTGAEQPWPCEIADFCAEGLFIRFDGGLTGPLRAQLGAAPERELVVRFRSQEAGDSHELAVEVVRLIEGAAGVHFTRSNPGAVEAMLALSQSVAAPEPSRLQPASDQVQFVLHQCSRAVIEHIEPLMGDCFRAMVGDLRDAGLNATSDQAANEFMDASGQMEARQSAVWLQMKRALESPLKPERGEVHGGSELSLVDKGEFEDWLMLRVMVTRADTMHRSELLPLRMRLDHLGLTNETGHQNPLGPALVCDAFHAGLQNLTIGREVEKLCLRALEKTVLNELGPLYEALNDILIRQNVLPDLDLSRYISRDNHPERPAKPATPSSRPEEHDPVTADSEPVARPPEPAPTQSADDSRQATFASHTALANNAFATVRNLLSTLSASRQASGMAPVSDFPSDAKPLSGADLQRELHGLQQASASRPADEESRPLKEQVVEKIRAVGDAALDDEQQETLDVVDRFFSSVVDSPRLNDMARGQLRKLEFPVLRVVMRDRRFFEDTGSPVRGVMNRLAQLGAKDARVSPVVERRIDELVQRIVTEFDQDTGVFESAQEELDSLIERQNLVYRRNVERVMAAAEGSQKVQDSKRAVKAALDSRFGGREVPRALLTLLEGGWRDLLSLTWIRQGADSPLWQDYLQVLDSLMAFGEDRDAQINLPELLRTIQEGLASISSNHMPSASIREELKQYVTRREDDPVEWVPYPDTPGPVEEGDTEPVPQQQRWLHRARRLQTGEWLSDCSDADHPQSIRLVWIARNHSRFVFVNHQGMRVSELTLDELAARLQAGTLVPDEEHDRPLVDESIDRMVKQVYDQLSWVSTHDEITGLLTRREFERVVEQHLARGVEGRTLVQVALRGLRLLNDTAGYQAGDDVLGRVALMLREHLGEGALARLDGHTFAWLTDADSAEAQTRELIRTIEGMNPEHEGRQYQLSASAGIAPPAATLVTADRWLRGAAQATGSAMDQGGGRIVHYGPDPALEARQEQIAARIAGLDNPGGNPLQLRCQKIIPLHGRTTMGTQYEVLISMYDDQGDLITGAEFVRMAERYDRMQAVDRWVVGQMLDWLRGGDTAGAGGSGLSINLSGHSLNDATLLEFIYETLSQQDAPIERLWFEITEAAAIRNLQEVAEFMREMRELGCRFCLGQLGSGPTSYEFMRALPVELVRLDGAFTRHVSGSELDRAMVRSMVDMAHYTGREVIAGLIEDRETLDVLTGLGVDYGQGYVVEKPQLLEQLLS